MIKKHLFLNKKSSFCFCVLTASLSVWLVCVLRPLCNIALQCPLATHLCAPVSETFFFFFFHCQVSIGLYCCQLHKFGLHNYLQYLVSPVFHKCVLHKCCFPNIFINYFGSCLFEMLSFKIYNS